MNGLLIVMFVAGVGLFTGGMHAWSGAPVDRVSRQHSWGLGAAAGGLVLLVSAVAMLPGWGS